MKACTSRERNTSNSHTFAYALFQRLVILPPWNDLLAHHQSLEHFEQLIFPHGVLELVHQFSDGYFLPLPYCCEHICIIHSEWILPHISEHLSHPLLNVT